MWVDLANLAFVLLVVPVVIFAADRVALVVSNSTSAHIGQLPIQPYLGRGDAI